MASTICMATAPVVGSSFELFSFRAILLFSLSIIAKGYFGYFSHAAIKLFSYSSYLRPRYIDISALFQPYCSYAAMRLLSHF